MVLHAIDSNYLVENAALELNGLKFACNASFQDCQLVILTALFARIDSEDLQASLTRLWTRWGPLLGKFTHGHQEELDLIRVVCNLCKTTEAKVGQGPPFEKAFNLAVPILYKTDVVEEGAIVEWYRNEAQVNGEDSLYCRQIRAFVTWLQAEDSDGSEGDEESEDEGFGDDESTDNISASDSE